VKTSFELLTARIAKLNESLAHQDMNPDTLLKATQMYESCANAMVALLKVSKELSAW
jgi:hypothetical protein